MNQSFRDTVFLRGVTLTWSRLACTLQFWLYIGVVYRIPAARLCGKLVPATHASSSFDRSTRHVFLRLASENCCAGMRKGIIMHGFSTPNG
jgi:hypothetical protein